MFSLIVVQHIIRRSTLFAITNPATHMLYTAVGPESKYKFKNFTETVIWRAGDTMATSVFLFFFSLLITPGGRRDRHAGRRQLDPAHLSTGTLFRHDAPEQRDAAMKQNSATTRFTLTCALIAMTTLGNLAQAFQVDGERLADRFANLALACVHKPYPNKLAHVLHSDEDAQTPQQLTPAFYGCYDWHSSVHGHWLLVRLMKLHPDADFADAARKALSLSLTEDNIATELAYIRPDYRRSFERPYGIAWFLQLAAELREFEDPDAQKWLAAITPLETFLEQRLTEWLAKLSYPIRTGEHSQTAFAFGLMLDWAHIADRDSFRALLEQRIREFYTADRACPLAYEPGGQDFLSPCLAQADLMRRVMKPDEYARWLETFMTIEEAFSLSPEVVTDKSDGKLAHLDGLNLSRAWMLEGMASALPADDPRRTIIETAAAQHARAGLAATTGRGLCGRSLAGQLCRLPGDPTRHPPGFVVVQTVSRNCRRALSPLGSPFSIITVQLYSSQNRVTMARPSPEPLPLALLPR